MTIDWWTLGIQAVNVAVLAWLLGWLFWRPVATIMAERRAAAGRILDEAEAKRKAAEADQADIAKLRAGFAAEREAAIAQAQAEARKAADAVLEAAHARAAEIEAAGQAAAKAAQEEAAAHWRAGAETLAVEIAGKLAARLDGAAVENAFLGWLLKELRGLPEAVRQGLDGAELQAVSAAPLAPEAQERCRAAVAEALGVRPDLTFTADPSLIAGMELRGPHLAVANSWRADLERIRATLPGAGHG